MIRFNLPLLYTVSMASFVFSEPTTRVDKAVFSDRQLFWPTLAAHGKAGTAKPGSLKPHTPKTRPSGGEAATRIAILPVTLKEYKESLACDSCHRLSANGMEFFLENWLKDRLHSRFPGIGVELVGPNQPLLEKRMDLIAYQDSLAFPWERWFPDPEERLVYRPKDRFTPEATRTRMDKLGGILGASHLLLPVKMRVSVTPESSITHEGGLEWGVSLVFWNVAAGAPEWVFRFQSQETGMNLDEALDGRLDKALGAAWDDLPGELIAQWKAEPR